MRKLGVAVVGVVCLALTACGSSKPKDLIVGKWHHVNDPKDVYEFTADGKYRHGDLTERRYRVTDANVLEFYDEGKEPHARCKLEVTKEDMTQISPDDPSRVEKFKRVK
jgi:hypothetical protein